MDTDSNEIATADERGWESVAMSLALASRFIILPQSKYNRGGRYSFLVLSVSR